MVFEESLAHLLLRNNSHVGEVWRGYPHSSGAVQTITAWCISPILEEHRDSSQEETVQTHDCLYAGLCGLILWCAAGCVQPIAPEVLLPRLQQRDPARIDVTFVALGDMGDGGS